MMFSSLGSIAMIAALTAAGQKPVARVDVSMVAAAGNGDGAAVLLRAVNAVGKIIVGGDVIHLRGRLVIPGGPCFAAIETDGRALIDAEHQVVRILWVDPNLVIIVAARSAAHNLDRLAAVFVR